MKIGVKPIRDYNSGDNKSTAPHVGNWYKGKRQPAGKACGLKGFEVINEKTVRKIILEDGPDNLKKATGIVLTTGERLLAKREVIVCCGTIRTPQLLMLSGIGPADEFKKHNIPLLVESPEVGKNFSDHSSVTQFYRIRDPERGLCAPSPVFFTNPTYIEGFPTDYIITESAPTTNLKRALQHDHPDQTITDTDPNYSQPARTTKSSPCTPPQKFP